MTLAEWIDAEGITRAQAAVRLHLSPSYLTELCQRKRTPSAHVAMRIAETSRGKVTLGDLVNPVPRGTATD